MSTTSTVTNYLMTKLLIYSFESFPYKIDVKPFLFHKLKEDLIRFQKLIDIEQPEIIIGIARSTNRISYFETQAINVFNKSKKVDKNGVDSYLLNYPSNGFKNIKLNHKSTDSFCNWTTYKISQLIERRRATLQFIHIAQSDIEDLNEYLSNFSSDS